MDYELIRGYRGMGSQFELQLAGAPSGSGSMDLELNVGGAVSETVMWDLLLVKNFDVYLRTLTQYRLWVTRRDCICPWASESERERQV